MFFQRKFRSVGRTWGISGTSAHSPPAGGDRVSFSADPGNLPHRPAGLLSRVDSGSPAAGSDRLSWHAPPNLIKLGIRDLCTVSASFKYDHILFAPFFEFSISFQFLFHYFSNPVLSGHETENFSISFLVLVNSRFWFMMDTESFRGATQWIN